MVLLLFFLSLFSSCEDNHYTSTFAFDYNLEQPDATFEMASDLLEISGLSMTSRGDELVAIQDEDGIIFFIDKQSGKIKRTIEFWKDGDYEGIEVVGDMVYVTKSTGTIYAVDLTQKEVATKKYNDDDLDKKNDVEGLGYDPVHQQLLLACKADAGLGSDDDFEKAIYGFDLKTNKLNPDPVYIITLSAIQEYLKGAPEINGFEKLAERFLDEDDEFSFHPSALAIHPHTGHLYICSSAGKMMLVLDQSGRVLHIAKMKKKIHEQPEGICFAPDGTLYIANEGRKGPGKIYRFNQR